MAPTKHNPSQFSHPRILGELGVSNNENNELEGNDILHPINLCEEEFSTHTKSSIHEPTNYDEKESNNHQSRLPHNDSNDNILRD